MKCLGDLTAERSLCYCWIGGEEGADFLTGGVAGIVDFDFSFGFAFEGDAGDVQGCAVIITGGKLGFLGSFDAVEFSMLEECEGVLVDHGIRAFGGAVLVHECVVGFGVCADCFLEFTG